MPTSETPSRRLTAWHAAAFYLIATLAWTWPLVPRITDAIAWDLGDPMFVAWVMGWVNDSLLALFRGDAQRFLSLWDAPIFYPERGTLAYSEHMLPQALMVFPLHAATGNVILAYNVALIATFVLSGIGMFLLARELTGSAPAALLAGAIFAFTPFRVDQLSHLHILSSQWMPFALYGLRRYFVTGRRRPLVWAALALVALNLSSGYYLFFFAPFVTAYAIGELWWRGLWRRSRTWVDLAIAALGVFTLTLPFLLPYVAARLGTVGFRPYGAILQFSADVHAYATSSAYIRWWRDTLDAMREAPENTTFPGLIAVIFAAGAAALWVSRVATAWRESRRREGRRSIAIAVFLALAALSAAGAVWIGLTGGRIFELAGTEVRLRNLARASAYAAIALMAALALSPRLREALRHPRVPAMVAAALAGAFMAFLLSLGPRMETMNEFIGHGPYALMLKVLPGFDGLRVPSRFAMIVVMWLAVAGAYAAAVLARRSRLGLIIVGVATVVAVAESRPQTFALDSPFFEAGHAPLTMTPRLAAAEPLYEALAREPKGVLLELPWGTTGWDLQYMHAQRRHGWPLVNGFSGFFPEGYARTSMVPFLFDSPDRAWWALERSGASHVIVHEWAFQSIDRGKRVSQWLRDHGAVEVSSTENDVLFKLPQGIQYR